MNFSVTKNGEPLDPTLYNWDESTKTFSSIENDLVLDFSDINGCTFKTESDCTFNTGSYCTFDTGSDCTFKTESDCVVIRKDIFEVITLHKQFNHIKLNAYKNKGYESIKTEEEIEQEEIEKKFNFEEGDFEI